MMTPRKLSDLTEEEANEATFILIYDHADGGVDTIAQANGKWYTLNIENVYDTFESVRDQWFASPEHYIIDIVWKKDIEEFKKDIW